jgi:hypothetical protein
MRLQFNKIGYEIYEKEQSRRVPAVLAATRASPPFTRSRPARTAQSRALASR